MAEGHAKLSMRDSKVSVFDAVAAIKLYEANMALHCGYTFFEPSGQDENVRLIVIPTRGHLESDRKEN